MTEQDKLKEAEELLKKADIAKQKQCSDEIQAVLNKYNFKMQVTPAHIVLVKAPETQGG